MTTHTVQRKHRWLTALAAAAMSALLSLPVDAAADTWNERTELTFSEPVMIPGATLQPGKYIFELADSRGSRHMVQIFKAGDGEPIAMTQAIPIRRPTPQKDTILTFNPTERGTPALKAWYYPYSMYGHEFIYPEEQASQIAERSKTVVLSVDVNGTDLEKGTLRLYHPGGNRSEWRADAETDKEWAAWQRQRTANANDHGDDDNGNGHPDAHAPMMMTNAPAPRVALDDIESNPAKFRGTTISVDGEVEEVYGPRLFTIDEPHWGDLDGEVLVYAPSMLAALVKDDDRVTITGTLKSVAMAEIEREWGWFELDPEIEVEFLKKPVLIADRIVGGDNNVALFLDMNGRNSGPASGSGVIADAAVLGEGTTDLVGRSVNLKNVKVLRTARDEGFFVDVPGGAVLVLPDRNVPVSVKPGDTVSILGAVAALPDRTAERVNPPSDWNRQIYIVATSVSK